MPGGLNQCATESSASINRTGKRRADQQNVGGLQETHSAAPAFRSNPPVDLSDLPIDGMRLHADTVHQPGSGGFDAAKPEDFADTTHEHAVSRELIKLTTFEVFVLQDQALGGGKCHGESVLGHQLTHFLDLQNVIASPHNSAQGDGAHDFSLRRADENCRRALTGEAPLHVIGLDERLM